MTPLLHDRVDTLWPAGAAVPSWKERLLGDVAAKRTNAPDEAAAAEKGDCGSSGTECACSMAAKRAAAPSPRCCLGPSRRASSSSVAAAEAAASAASRCPAFFLFEEDGPVKLFIISFSLDCRQQHQIITGILDCEIVHRQALLTRLADVAARAHRGIQMHGHYC